MGDVHDKATRSYNMSRIKSKDTKPELIVRKYIHGQGFRYRLNAKQLPGKPDIVLPKYKTIIFVHGCFGTGMEAVNIIQFPTPEQIGGLRKSPRILRMMKGLSKV